MQSAVIRIRDELTDGGIPEGFEVEIHEQPSAFSNGTYMLRVENTRAVPKHFNLRALSLEMYRMRPRGWYAASHSSR